MYQSSENYTLQCEDQSAETWNVLTAVNIIFAIFTLICDFMSLRKNFDNNKLLHKSTRFQVTSLCWWHGAIHGNQWLPGKCETHWNSFLESHWNWDYSLFVEWNVHITMCINNSYCVFLLFRNIKLFCWNSVKLNLWVGIWTNSLTISYCVLQTLTRTYCTYSHS